MAGAAAQAVRDWAYYQISGERRQIVDNPRKNQLESLQSKNIDFIVEEYGAAVLIENLTYTK